MPFLGDNGLTYDFARTSPKIAAAHAFMEAYYENPNLDQGLQAAACTVIPADTPMRPLRSASTDKRYLVGEDETGIRIVLGLIVHPAWLPDVHVFATACAADPAIDDEAGYVALMKALVKEMDWPGCEDNTICAIHADHHYSDAREALFGAEHVEVAPFQPDVPAWFEGELPAFVRSNIRVQESLIQSLRGA